MNIRILGSGSSGGVPLIGCRCAVCTSSDPRNKRTRSSILVAEGETKILIDASPDLRQQFLAYGVTGVDAVLLTHAHADHLHGIDDLRSVNYARNAPLNIWGSPECLAETTRRFAYAFEPPKTNQGIWYAPSLVPRPIEGAFSIGALHDIRPMLLDHGIGREPVLGFRFGKFAYTTDVHTIPDAAWPVLAGVDVWLVDCLSESPNWAHSNLAQTLAWIDRTKPKRAILTHMNHSVDYATWAAKLPTGIEPGYDGMEFEVV